MKIRFTQILIAFLLTAFGANAQVNNSGFEQLNSDGTLSYWGNVYIESVWFDSTGVAHSDSIVYDGASYYYSPTNDAHSGNTAMELRNSWNITANRVKSGAAGVDDDSVFTAYGLSNLIPTFATPQNPFNPLDFGFYYKYSPVNGDTAYAEITLWDSIGNMLGSGLILITNSASSYTLISAPIDYVGVGQADFYSLTIGTFYSIEPGSHEPSYGTRLTVDDIGFNFNPQSVNNVIGKKSLNVFPNPSSGIIVLKSQREEINSAYTLTDISGRIVLQGLITGETMQMNLENFERGIYVLKTQNGEKKIILSDAAE